MLFGAGAPQRVIGSTKALDEARHLALAELSARNGNDGANALHPAEAEPVLRVDRIDVPDMPGDSGLVSALVIAELRRR